MPDLISVIVTTYEREDALDAVLRSLAAQRDRRFRDRGGRRRLGACDRRADRTLAAAHRRAARSRLAGAPRLPRRRDAQPRAPRRARRLLRVPRRRLHRAAGLRRAAPAACRARLVRRRQPRAALAAADRRGAAARGSTPETWTRRGLAGAAPAAAASTGWPRCSTCRSVRCASSKRTNGRARAPAISRSGAPISIAVDGFDASFNGWGREDSDLLVRLLRAGVRRKDGRFATGVIHLWHPAADRAQLTANDAKLEAVIQGTRIRAETGLSALRSTVADATEPTLARPPG